MGALPHILDNLIAHGRIEPVMAVFIDPRTVDTGENSADPSCSPTRKLSSRS